MLVDPSTIMFPLQFTNLGLLAPTVEEVKDDEDTLAFDAVEPTQASPHENHNDDGGDGRGSDSEAHGADPGENAEDDANMDGLTSLVDAIASDAAVE